MHASGLPTVTLPLSPAEARSLKLGDTVMLAGEVSMTAGLPVHQRLVNAVANGEAAPFPMRGTAFFHMGSSCRQVGGRWLPNYVNPTTSTRFDAYMPALIREFALTSTGGKGGMGAACVDAMREVGCVYFSMPGGASPLLSDGAVERLETGWDDLIEQFRLSRFRFAAFGPVTVGIDAHGNSMYAELQRRATERLPRILQELEEARQHATARRKLVTRMLEDQPPETGMPRNFEDFEIGQTWTSKSVVLSEDDIIRYARENDPQPMHTDPGYAAKSRFGSVIASGWQIAALSMRLFIEGGGYGDTPVVGLGIDELRWRKPVRAGDRLHVVREVVGAERSRSKPQFGIIRTKVTVRNQHDEDVMTLVSIGQVPTRSQEGDPSSA